MSIILQLFCSLILLLTGCSDRVHVSGKILLRSGEPVTKGLVVFENEKLSGISDIKTDGSYSIGLIKRGEGIPPGIYNIAIQATGTMGSVNNEMSNMSSDNPPKVIPETTQVDMKYTLPQTSGLSIIIETGKSITHDIIVDPPKP
ncbi:MAG: carboxypeptidase-like regulatory domain-containing protein [Planctomycetaceae bacterium]|nr:carboxypeptidase-like regulatory domain-containing protein [Planctomycetaceae bacterium]